MVCDPTARVELEYVATPPVPTEPVPICVPPSRNATVPVTAGVAAAAILFVELFAEAVTVAVNVMFVPDVAFVDDADKAVLVGVVVEPPFTTCETAGDVEVA